jgi:thymidylate synthase
VGDCLTHGQPVAGTLEIQGVAYTLSDPHANVIYNRVRASSPGYAMAELGWYLHGSYDLKPLLRYAPSYAKFSDDDGKTVYGGYGPRGLSLESLKKVAKQLIDNPTSRQVVVPIWRSADRDAQTKDMPCTVALHFIRREKGLSLHVYMRSNDLYLGFIYDIFCFTMIQQLVASMIECPVDMYTHHVGSLHIYDRNLEKLKEAMTAQTATYVVTDFNEIKANRLVRAVIDDYFPTPSTTVSTFNTLMEKMKNARHRGN